MLGRDCKPHALIYGKGGKTTMKTVWQFLRR
jgi:hypothetical protein